MDEEFSIHGGAYMSTYQDSGSSDPYCSINVFVDGMLPQPGRTGPGIRIYAKNMEQLRKLNAWVVSKLTPNV